MYNNELSTTVNNNTPINRILVSLSDGETLIQDNRPNTDHFWKRLKKMIENSEVSITMIRYQTPQGIISLPANCKYYYFMQAKSGNVGETCIDSIKIGYSNDGITISAIELSPSGQKQIEIPFSRGGFGLI